MSVAEFTQGELYPARQPDRAGADEASAVQQLHPQETEGVLLSDNPIELAHGKVCVAGNIVRYTGAFPEVIECEGAGLIAPGFGGFKTSSRNLRGALAEGGLPTFSYEPIRRDKDGLRKRLLDPQDAHEKTIEAIMADLQVNTALKRKVPNGNKIDFRQMKIIAHSMGGAAAGPAAEANPDMVSEVYFLAVVGFGSPTLRQLIKSIPEGAADALTKELIPFLRSGEIELTPRNIRKAIGYFISNPARTVGEMGSCLTSDIRPAVKHLGELGIFTAHLGFEHDMLVPGVEDIADIVDKHEVMENVGHLAPLSKARLVAAWILNTHQSLAVAA